MSSTTTSGPPGQTKPCPEPSQTGTIPFTIPGTDIKCETAYWLWGSLSSSTTPLICLHGGPGVPHQYLLPISHLSSEPHNIPVIMYDQVGCGKSTRLKDRKGDSEFWTPQLFMRELENLVSHFHISSYDLLGQSWGGMLSAQYATTRPEKLNRLIVADSPASMVTWVQVANKLRSKLPQDVQDTLTRCERDGTTDTKEYDDAAQVFLEKHACRVVPWPKELLESLGALKDDDTVYLTMNGPSEFHVIGTLKEWNITKDLHKINVPTLLINGRYDEAQDEVMQPFFKEIEKVKWVRFAESSHMPQLEETDECIEVLGHFLQS
ncbi:hypothetical protein LTR50_005590 [Elasticomyces elasticus]|nr:hypothetical protein LTR50_005590 [Elasticomyces elasticus]